MATIKDVAKLAGVSVSTVSRALSDSTAVSKEKRKRIQRAVEELHFVPDHKARALKNGRTKIISLIIPTILNPFFPHLVSCFSSEINRYGYAAVLYVTNYSKAEEIKSFESAKAFSSDGILYVPGTDDRKHVQELLDFHIPTVIVNRKPDVNAPCVTNNDYLGAYRALEFLIRNGHEKICCFVGDRSLQHMRERGEGCRQAFSDYGINLDYIEFAEHDTATDIYHFVRHILSLEQGITAFYASSDWMTKAIYSGIQSSGLEIPEDISVVGFDDISDSQFMFPPLTTWHHPIEIIAKKAVEMLVDRLENGTDISGSRIVVSGQMIIRGSTRMIGSAPVKKQVEK